MTFVTMDKAIYTGNPMVGRRKNDFFHVLVEIEHARAYVLIHDLDLTLTSLPLESPKPPLPGLRESSVVETCYL